MILSYLPYLVIILLLSYIIWQENRAPNKFHFIDYFSDNGVASTPKTLQVLAGVTGTIVIIQSSVADHLTPELFGIYLAALGISEGWSRYITSKIVS
jgi:hypothetical protein